MEQSQQREQGQETAAHCYWHPDAETGLSCGQCGKPMCTRCMVQAPVGIRCRECGKAVRMPAYEVQPTHYARSIAVGVAVAIGGGLLWSLFTRLFGSIPFFSPLVGIAVGYAAGEVLSLSVNRKRGTKLAWIAAASVVGAFLISWRIAPFGYGIYGLLFLAVGVFIAVQKVR